MGSQHTQTIWRLYVLLYEVLLLCFRFYGVANCTTTAVCRGCRHVVRVDGEIVSREYSQSTSLVSWYTKYEKYEIRNTKYEAVSVFFFFFENGFQKVLVA